MEPHDAARPTCDGIYEDRSGKWTLSECQLVYSTAERGWTTNVDDELAFEEVMRVGDQSMSEGERKEGTLRIKLENSVGGDEKVLAQCNHVSGHATIEKEDTKYLNNSGHSMHEGSFSEGDAVSEVDSVWYPSVTLEVMDPAPNQPTSVVAPPDTHAASPPARHDCDRCGKRFDSAASRQLHKLTHHDLARRYVCDACGATFFDRAVMARHVREHRGATNHKRRRRIVTNPDVAELFPRDESGARFPERPAWDGRRATSCARPEYDCDRPGCGRRFAQKGTLKRHRLTHGQRQAVYTCDVLLCGKRFDREDKLDRHLWIMHSVNRAKKTYACEEDACGQQFKREHNLKNHVKSAHSDAGLAAGKPTVFVCDVAFCKKTFSTKGNLKKHSYSHRDDPETGKRTFACDRLDCGRVFKRECNLASHLALVHSSRHGKSRFACRAAGCEKRFTQKGNLNRHAMLVHAPDERKTVFPCDHPRCGKRFNLKCSLKMHSLVHDAESRPFACEKCGRKFNRKSSLKKHVLVHDETKPFACDVCARQFIRKYRLQSHVRSKHSDGGLFGCGVLEQDRMIRQFSSMPP